MAIPTAHEPPANADGAARQESGRHWDKLSALSSVPTNVEHFLASRPFERGPWLAVAFGAGIAAWLVLPGPWQWCALIALLAAIAMFGLSLSADGAFGHLRLALFGMAVMAIAGCATVWTKSAFVGAPPIPRPQIVRMVATVVDRQDEAAQARVRLLLEAHLEGERGARRVRVNLPVEQDSPTIMPGAVVALRVRLMPPAPPMLPGGYDFARAAWFQGLAATGSVIGPVSVMRAAVPKATLRDTQQRLAAHVRSQLGGSAGTIAAAFASGDRGAIAPADEDAMRDSGLTHLLSISGVHVSAVIAGVYFLTIRLLALVPFIALRLPLVALAAGALAGIGYTLLTGAEVPTVRSCFGAVLVLAAVAMGRDPLSLRMLATGAVFVMLFWPEAVWGPSFQMSFASVIAIIAFHNAAPARRFLARRDEGRLLRLARHALMLLATGLVIELALMPIALFHFHRAGIYGAAANVVAIPLTEVVTMPLIALALLLDLVGAGAPAWWLVGQSLEFLLWLAHVTASQPGAVTMMPGMPGWTFGVFIAGLLWLALWSGAVRLWGFVPIVAASAVVLEQRVPDVLITGDGHHVGITGEGADLLMLRATRGDFTRDAMLEMAASRGGTRTIDEWPGARCNRDFCTIVLKRAGKPYVLLMARGRDRIDTFALSAACERADIVVADRFLPQMCKPRLLKADRTLLSRTGGLSIDLARRQIRTVAQTEGQHGWFNAMRDARSAIQRTNASEKPALPDDAVRPTAQATSQ